MRSLGRVDQHATAPPELGIAQAARNDHGAMAVLSPLSGPPDPVVISRATWEAHARA
jgi:hypothetical protein